MIFVKYGMFLSLPNMYNMSKKKDKITYRHKNGNGVLPTVGQGYNNMHIRLLSTFHSNSEHKIEKY